MVTFVAHLHPTTANITVLLCPDAFVPSSRQPYTYYSTWSTARARRVVGHCENEADAMELAEETGAGRAVIPDTCVDRVSAAY